MESVSILPSLESMSEPINLFEKFLRKFKISNHDRMLWNLSLTEVLANAIYHGSNHWKGDAIDINWKYESHAVELTITDRGTGPCTKLIELPSLPEDLTTETGRGLFIVNSFVDIWLHRKSVEGYSQTLIKFMN